MLGSNQGGSGWEAAAGLKGRVTLMMLWSDSLVGWTSIWWINLSKSESTRSRMLSVLVCIEARSSLGGSSLGGSSLGGS